MKNILLVILCSVVTAALLGYTLKNPDAGKAKNQLLYAHCSSADVRDTAAQEASTKAFAALHQDPIYFQLKDPKGQIISFTTPDGQKAAGYEIKSGKSTKNYLFVFHEWYGLNDYIKQESDNLSSELDNVNVIALDLYDGKVASTADSAMKYMSAANTQRLENIIKGAMEYAGKNAKIYTVGWCFGGMWSLQASLLAGKQAAGCVMYYGRPETNVEKLKLLNTDVIGFFGNLDKSITPDKVTDFENNMKAAGKKLTVYRYDAAHGFANPSNPSFDKAAREDSHQKTIQFIKSKI